mmetsp:Transcript_50392/g.116321  ORF Transcript_50392/g.116321 Transcript_50392/m.116321 type:complete len:274 (+) Transcript_50392:553-1374(+)
MQGEIDHRQVGHTHPAAVTLDSGEAKRREEEDDQLTGGRQLRRVELGVRDDELVRLPIVRRHPMPRARDPLEELRHRVDEIDHLRDEEEQYRLRVVPKNADDCKRHARKVAVGVANEDLRRMPVELQQRGGHGDERQHQAEREEVIVVQRSLRPTPQLDEIVRNDRQSDHHRLPCLEAIHACEDVDRVGAEDGEGGHKHVVQDADVDRAANERIQRLGRHHDGATSVDRVDHQQRQRGRQGEPQLVPPPQVKDVIGESKEAHAADGEERAEEL